MALEPGLYVAATPIGNLKDITYRVVETLKAADLILCEDTRQTAKLCAAYGIETPRRAYHDHNAHEVRPGIIERLLGGEAICLVSDAGTPLISDPGFKLVREARAAGVAVTPLPGACAAIAALSAAGAPSDRFLFAGFPPVKQAARADFLKGLARVEATLLFYETGPRLAASLAAMAETLGDREAIVAREITKIHEEFISGSLADLAKTYEAAAPKGEIVVVVHPPVEKTAGADEINAFIRRALREMSVKDAAAAAADAFSIPKRQAYGLALAMGQSNDG